MSKPYLHHVLIASTTWNARDTFTLVSKDLKLVEKFAGADGRLRFATTEGFLQRFGLASLQELTAALVLA